MQVKEDIEQLNTAISQGIKTGSINAYGVCEYMKVGDSVIIKTVGSDNQVSIDDSYDAVLWHKLVDSSISPYEGRGKINYQTIDYRVKILCYSKNLSISDYLISVVSNDSSRQVTRVSYDKQTVMASEIPEAQRNFDIDAFFFSIEYTIKAVIAPNCYTDFCFK